MSSPSAAPKRSLWTLLSVVVIDLIGFGIIIPILPFYAEEYGASPRVLGFLVASFAGMQFLLAPVWGRLSDRIGRRPVILLTIAGTAVALSICAWAPSLEWLFLGRILGGIFGANIGLATAYITDLTQPEERTRWMGMIGASFGVGFLLGPVIGGGLAGFGYHIPFLLASVMAALNFLYAFFRLEEPARRVPKTQPRSSPAAAALRGGLVLRMTVINFFFTFGVTQLETMFAFFMIRQFAYGVRGVTVLLVVMALIMVGIQGGAIRGLSRRFGEVRLLLVGSALLAGSFAAIPFMPSVAILVLPLAISSVGRGVAQPSMLSLVSRATTEKNRGLVMGRFQSSASLARVLGPLAAGTLFELRLWGPFVTAGIAMVCVVAIAFGLKIESVREESPAV